MKTSEVLNIVLTCFVAGWVGYGLSLYDIAATYSINLLLLASAALGCLWWRAGRLLWLAVPVVLSWLLSASGGLDQTYATTVLTHSIQQGLALGLALGVASLSWARCLRSFRTIFLVTSLVVLLYGLYQFVARQWNLPYAYLEVTNLQYNDDEGFQRGYTTGLLRVSSFFVEPSDLGRFMLWAVCLGLGCREPVRRAGLLTLGIAGVLLSQSLGAVLGIIVVFLAYLCVVRRALPLLAGAGLLTVAFLGLLFLFPEPMSVFLDRFEKAMALDSEADSNRLALLPSNLAVFAESPWTGHGLASVAQVEPAGVAVGYMVFLIERGVVGTVLLLLPFAWAGYRLARRARSSEDFPLTALLLLVVELYCLSTFAMVYFPPLWFALGMAIRAAGQPEPGPALARQAY